MFKWKDGVKISDAYVNEDGSITSAQYEGDTPLSAHCLNMAQQELVDDMSKTHVGTNITAETVKRYRENKENLWIYRRNRNR